MKAPNDSQNIPDEICEIEELQLKHRGLITIIGESHAEAAEYIEASIHSCTDITYSEESEIISEAENIYDVIIMYD